MEPQGSESGTFVPVREAARRLGVNPSTVSRQAERLGVARNQHGHIDFEDYVARRGDGLNPLMARNGGAAGDPDGTLPFAGAAAAAPRRNGLTAASTAVKALQAKKLQLEVDEKEGKLVARAEVNEQLATASRTLRDALLGLPARLAGDLATMADATEIRRLLDKELNHLLTMMAADFARVSEPERKPS